MILLVRIVVLVQQQVILLYTPCRYSYANGKKDLTIMSAKQGAVAVVLCVSYSLDAFISL